jgi:hypothetical protein
MTTLERVETARALDASSAHRTNATARTPDRRAIAAIVLLALWGGGALLMVSTVAPAAFRALPTRVMAGAVVGQILPVVFISGLVIGVAALMLVAPNSSWARTRRVAAAGTLIGCGIAQFVIGPRIASIRAAIGPSVEALGATDPLRVSFGRLHAFSVFWLGVGMLCALVALIATLRSIEPRRQ